MTAVLDDQVRMMESAWFMSYPHDVYARLRREAPVYWSPRDEMWAISKYEDIRWISKTARAVLERYHIYVTAAKVDDAGRRSPTTRAMPRRPSCAAVAGMGPLTSDNLVMADGTRHRFLRKIASYTFTPKAIARSRQQVQRLAVELFEEIPEDVEVDFVDTVAAPLPMIMIALMLGVPLEADRELPTVVRLVHRDVRGHAASTTNDGRRQRQDRRHHRVPRVLRRTAEGRGSPTRSDDLLTKLSQAEWEGELLEHRGPAVDGARCCSSPATRPHAA